MGHNNLDLKVTWLDSNLVLGSQVARLGAIMALIDIYAKIERACLREWNDVYQIIEYNWIVSGVH